MIDLSLYVASPPRLRPVGARQLVRELAAQLSDSRAALVFDADGTLWFADVGDDVFLAAIERSLLKDDARSALSQVAARRELPASGSASEIGRALRDAFRAGRLPEHEMFEVMTWCYAGWTLEELADHTEDVLARSQMARRLNPELGPVLEWARRIGLCTAIVSASPGPVVEIAARLWGFAPEDVAAAKPAMHAGRIDSRLAAPLPYGRAKADVARALIGERHLLASFGDSAFDLEMLLSARVAVAVSPKPELRALIGELSAQPSSIADTWRALSTTAQAATHIHKRRDWTRSSSQT
jgi:phosphatidylglycerophosphatase C